MATTKLWLLNEQFSGTIGWKEPNHDLCWCMVYDSYLIVYWDERRKPDVFYCLSLFDHQFTPVALSRNESQSCIKTIRSSLEYVIGKTKHTIKNGVTLRGSLSGGSVHQTGSSFNGDMATMEGWVNERVPPNDGIEQTYSYYQLKRTIDQGNYMLHCAMHFVAMNTLERLNCPGVDAARWDDTKLVRGIQPNLG